MTSFTKDLATKLGFTSGDSVFVETTPDWYTDFADGHGIELEAGLPATHAHIFCNHEAELADFLEYNNLGDIEKSLWICWPTKDSGKQTDLGENEIRDSLTALGWVAAEAAAMDGTWSGLQFLRKKTS